jgi:hypothetical protein
VITLVVAGDGGELIFSSNSDLGLKFALNATCTNMD